MVVYNYSVSQDGPTTSIQAAIDAVVIDLESAPELERDIEINVTEGVYGGFTIPDGALLSLLSSSYRVKIQSAGSFFPIIDFNVSSERQLVGIDLGSGNPNVTIKGLRVQYFAVGIRAGLNSHYPIVEKCLVTNNRNAGIFFEQCKQVQVLQSIIVNGDYGLVARLCKDISVIHNTIFSNGAISTEVGKSVAGAWLELAHDYGGGLTDSGKIHLIGNIIWNTAGRCLTLFQDDVERLGALVSNYNDLVAGDTTSYIVLEDRVFYKGAGARPRKIISTLSEWKSFGFDRDSKNEDPRFISPIKIRANRNGFAIDLNILPISPVLGIVPSFFVDAAAAATWLPAYTDSSKFSKDLLNNNRLQNGTAAGANDKASSAGFFGQDIFSNPLDLGLTKNCAVDPLFNIILKKLDIWFPKLKAGYFYGYEREYYLYSKKGCSTLGELAVTKFNLPARVVHNLPIKAYINGTKINDNKYIDIVGDKLYLNHHDLFITNGNEEIDINVWIQDWKGSGFTYANTDYVFKVSEGQTTYLLPSEYYPRGPVVVTDDMSYPSDSDYIANREFSVSWNAEHQRSELKFANSSNLLLNAQFDYGNFNDVIWWQHSGAHIGHNGTPSYTVAGMNCCFLDPTGFVRQVVPCSTGEQTLSWHTAGTTGSICDWSVEFYDANFDKLGYVLTGSSSVNTDWTRHYIVMGSSGDAHTELIPQLPYPIASSGYYPNPDRASYLSFQLRHRTMGSYTGYMLLDAIQYELSSRPSLFHRKPLLAEMTVEYETKEDEYFIDTHLNLSPTVNLFSNGFLHIPELSARVYDGPNTSISTTLHDWRWQFGRKNILPWARTLGKDKLRKRPESKFHLIPSKKTEIIAPVTTTYALGDVLLSPATVVVRQGDTNGVGLTILVSDTNGNPLGGTNIVCFIQDDNLKFPGWLHKRKYGLKEQLGQVINSTADSAGAVNLTWIPPSETSGRYVGPTPIPTVSAGDGDNLSSIDTNYPVNLDHHGNIIILDRGGRVIPTKPNQPIINKYTPTYANQTSRVKVEYPISQGSVKILIDGIYLTESSIDSIDSDQFFVDYENSTISIRGRFPEIQVEYTPSYVFISQINPYKIMFYHNKVFGSYTDSITVGYDYSITLLVSAEDPGVDSRINQKFSLVAQNSLLNRPELINTISLEI